MEVWLGFLGEEREREREKRTWEKADLVSHLCRNIQTCTTPTLLCQGWELGSLSPLVAPPLAIRCVIVALGGGGERKRGSR